MKAPPWTRASPDQVRGQPGLRKQVEDRIQSAVVDRVSRLRPDDRLGVIRHADVREPQHRQIVGAIADRHKQPVIAFELAPEARERRSLHLTIDDLAGDASGEPAAGDLQRAGDGMVETEPGLEPFGEEGEAAGYEERLRA